ncbi:MAG: hypothetical protein NT049_05955 [Planctomycetota bacterium]|nr:hypothetical protein [Planctomycetota bacterium]
MSNDELLETLQETIAEARATGNDRRAATERRSGRPSNYGGPERRDANGRRSGLERRDNRERRAGLDRRHALRRNEDQQAFQKRVEEGELTLEEVEFVRAVDRYKRKFNRPFPTWSEVLAIVKELGYTRDSLS